MAASDKDLVDIDALINSALEASKLRIDSAARAATVCGGKEPGGNHAVLGSPERSWVSTTVPFQAAEVQAGGAAGLGNRQSPTTRRQSRPLSPSPVLAREIQAFATSTVDFALVGAVRPHRQHDLAPRDSSPLVPQVPSARSWSLIVSFYRQSEQYFRERITSLARELESVVRTQTASRATSRTISGTIPPVHWESRSAPRLRKRIHYEVRQFTEILPMYSIKTHLLSALRSSQVIILSAGPGTGKSTQIAQYLVDYRDALCWDHSVAYVSTSASMRSLADHIALQMNEPLTTFHSFRYKIGVSDGSRPVLEIFRPSDLLDLKKQDAVLSSYDVILIDDAHERAVDLDLSLALLRHLLLQRQDLKLVLMTPLVKDGSLQAFFGAFPPRILTVPDTGSVPYPVKLIYRPIQAGLANQSQLAEHICVGLIRTLHQFDAIGTPSNRPVHMAVFLPCLREATVLKSMLENQMSWALASKVDVVFAPDAGEPVAIEPSASKRACFTVHLCWNGRENALPTEICYVVDSGLRCSRSSDASVSHIHSFSPISKSSAWLRMLVAARSRSPGTCVRVYTEQEYVLLANTPVSQMAELDFFGRPWSIDLAVLRMKRFKVLMPDVQDFFRLPSGQQVTRADLDAVEKNLSLFGCMDEDGHLTSMGSLAADALLTPPLIVLISRAAELGCQADGVALAAMLSVWDTLRKFLDDKFNSAWTWAMDSSGDFLTLLRIWCRWMSSDRTLAWCEESGISFVALRRAEKLVSLIRAGLIDRELLVGDWSNPGFGVDNVHVRSNILRCVAEAYLSNSAISRGCAALAGYRIFAHPHSLEDSQLAEAPSEDGTPSAPVEDCARNCSDSATHANEQEPIVFLRLRSSLTLTRGDAKFDTYPRLLVFNRLRRLPRIDLFDLACEVDFSYVLERILVAPHLCDSVRPLIHAFVKDTDCEFVEVEPVLNVGPHVWVRLASLEQIIRVPGHNPVFSLVDRDQCRVRIWADPRESDWAREVVLKRIDEMRTVGSSMEFPGMGATRFVVGPGAETLAILETAEGHKVIVKNIEPAIQTQRDLQDYFARYGKVLFAQFFKTPDVVLQERSDKHRAACASAPEERRPSMADADREIRPRANCPAHSGCVIFETDEAANAAVKSVNAQASLLDGGGTIAAMSCTKLIKNPAMDQVTSGPRAGRSAAVGPRDGGVDAKVLTRRVAVEWYIGVPTGHAFINFINQEDARRAAQDMGSGAGGGEMLEYQGRPVRCIFRSGNDTTNRPFAWEIVVHNIDARVKPAQLWNFFSRWGRLHSVAICGDPLPQFRAGKGLCNRAAAEKKLKELFTSAIGPCSVSVMRLPTTDKSHLWGRAMLKFQDPMHYYSVLELDGKISFKGMVPIRITPRVDCRLTVSTENFQYVLPALDDLADELRRQTSEQESDSFISLKIDAEARRKLATRTLGPTVAIIVTASKPEHIFEVRSRIEHLLLGQLVSSENRDGVSHVLSTDGGRSFLRGLESRHSSLRVVVAKGNVRLYGSARHRHAAEAAILEYVATHDASRVTQKISIPFGGIKVLLGSDGRGLERLERKYDVRTIIDGAVSMVTLTGHPRSVDLAKEEVTVLLSTLVSPDRTVLDQHPCPLCMCPVDNAFRLGNCGHAYCHGCVVHLLHSAESNKSFPVKCIRCSLPVVLSDINLVLNPDELVRMFRASMVAYIERNPEIAGFCPTPDCPQVFLRKHLAGRTKRPSSRVELQHKHPHGAVSASQTASTASSGSHQPGERDSENEMVCPTTPTSTGSHLTPLSTMYECDCCLNAYCLRCNYPYHHGLSCSDFQRKIRGEKRLEKAALRWKQVHTRPCPGCSAPIEKAEGCNHIQCRNCLAHFCWECLQAFPSAVDTYLHMQTDHPFLPADAVAAVENPRRGHQVDILDRADALIDTWAGATPVSGKRRLEYDLDLDDGDEEDEGFDGDEYDDEIGGSYFSSEGEDDDEEQAVASKAGAARSYDEDEENDLDDNEELRDLENELNGLGDGFVPRGDRDSTGLLQSMRAMQAREIELRTGGSVTRRTDTYDSCTIS